MLLIDPTDLPRVSGLRIDRKAFDREAVLTIQLSVPDILISVLLDLLRTQILVCEFASDKRSRIIARGNTLHSLKGRQVQPLVVRLHLVSIRQKCSAFNITRLIERYERLIAIAYALERPHSHFPRA